MQVRDIMTQDPACCMSATPLQQVAKLMVDCDCGEIPVVDEQRRPIGVVTDRDIACRAVAQGLDIASTRAADIMSSPVVTVRPDESLDEVRQKMEDNRIRRVPVVDSNGACCGMVAQADIARHGSEREVGGMVRDVSQSTQSSSRLGH